MKVVMVWPSERVCCCSQPPTGRGPVVFSLQQCGASLSLGNRPDRRLLSPSPAAVQAQPDLDSAKRCLECELGQRVGITLSS